MPRFAKKYWLLVAGLAVLAALVALSYQPNNAAGALAKANRVQSGEHVKILGPRTFTPNVPQNNNPWVKNTGKTKIKSLLLEFQPDTGVTIVSAAKPYKMRNGWAQWTFANVPPGKIRSVKVTLNYPPLPQGDVSWILSVRSRPAHRPPQAYLAVDIYPKK